MPATRKLRTRETVVFVSKYHLTMQSNLHACLAASTLNVPGARHESGSCLQRIENLSDSMYCRFVIY